jgi:DNA invertase Pin-like site-specific DNA recombinase
MRLGDMAGSAGRSCTRGAGSNVLLSFAQFEREVTGERIRDKIAASKKKSLWMGGQPALGYDVKDKKLIMNEAEAETVRMIFHRYLELGSVRELKGSLDAEGVVSKRTTAADGARSIRCCRTGSIVARSSTEAPLFWRAPCDRRRGSLAQGST